MSDRLIGTQFDRAHAAGVARYEVRRPHRRDAGFFECVIVAAIGSHRFIGGIEIIGTAEIRAAIANPSCACGTLTGYHDAGCQLLPAGLRRAWEAANDTETA